MPLIDRLLRGRGWIAIVGVLLAGIVFLNVSVLELNRGIARTDAKSSVLERSNSGLRQRVATLDSGERIQQLAAKQGFVLPQPGDVTFIRPHTQSDAKLAAARITAPDSSLAATTTPSTASAPPTTSAPATAAPTPAPTTTQTTPATTPVQQPAPAAPVPAAATPQPVVAQSTGTTTPAP
jgi:cell division protein FtsL